MKTGKLFRQIGTALNATLGNWRNVLTEFSAKFIQEHFNDKDDWREQFRCLSKRKTKNREQKLVLDDITVENGVIWQRAKSASKAGKRDISLLVQVPPEQSQTELEFCFQDNDLQDNQIKLRIIVQLKKSVSGELSRARGKAPVLWRRFLSDGNPCFFSLELTNRNEFSRRVQVPPVTGQTRTILARRYSALFPVSSG